jgi:UDP-GlcNAc:undecaprenyl-phosphate GlcNAc-1-phosphate transferase
MCAMWDRAGREGRRYIHTFLNRSCDMVLADIFHLPLLLLVPAILPGWAMLLLGGIGAFLLAYGVTFGVKGFCQRMGWLDRPAERRVHKIPVPRLGGVAIYLAFVIISLLFYIPGPQNEIDIYWLLLAAGLLIVVVHAYDDVKGLGPWPKLAAQTLAVLLILGPWWDGLFHGVLLFTVNNPFGSHIANPALPWYQQPTIKLLIDSQVISWAALPAILLTWFWTVGMMNTVNWIDGMDGLATGVVGITGLFIMIISLMLRQQSIAVLSAIFTGAVFGFLPHNWHPAKVFMGDCGAMFLGLALAVLSIMGGAKLALAFMVLGVPILDVALVIINRIRRGQSPLHYDKTHLHHRLMATGFSVRQICYLLYGLALIFGLLAVGISGLQVGAAAHFSKLIGIVLVIVVMVTLIIWVDYRQRQRGIPIKLDGPENTPGAATPMSPAPENTPEATTPINRASGTETSCHDANLDCFSSIKQPS